MSDNRRAASSTAANREADGPAESARAAELFEEAERSAERLQPHTTVELTAALDDAASLSATTATVVSEDTIEADARRDSIRTSHLPTQQQHASPYRVAQRGNELILATKPSTFWHRLLMRVRAVLQTSLYVAIAFAILVGIAAGFLLILGAPSAWLAQGAAVMLAVFLVVVVIGLLIAAVSALGAPPLEVALPKVLRLTETGVHVVPREGEPYDTDASFVCGYELTSSRIVLVLARVPRLEIQVAHDTLSSGARDLLLGWLRSWNVRRDE